MKISMGSYTHKHQVRPFSTIQMFLYLQQARQQALHGNVLNEQQRCQCDFLEWDFHFTIYNVIVVLHLHINIRLQPCNLRNSYGL